MPSKTPLRIVIVGGVAGGMSAATRARRLDEHALITVFDKGPYIGYANCGIPYALGGVIEDDALILQTPEALHDRFNIDIQTNTEVVQIDREKHTVAVRSTGAIATHNVTYDKLILACGAEPYSPPLEGINLPHVFHLQTISDLERIKQYISEHESDKLYQDGMKQVAVIGGGFIGLEAAENLHLLELKVVIIEAAPHVFPPVDSDIATHLHTEIRNQGIGLYTNTRIQRIEAARDGHPARIVFADNEAINADLVICAVGIRARTELARAVGLKVRKQGVSVNVHMQTSDPDIYAVGDMVETPHRVSKRPRQLALAGPANRQGRLVASNICGEKLSDIADIYRGNVGTAICKVFDLTVGSVGLSVSELRALDEPVEYITVHPPDHAAYYPGSAQLTLKVLFNPASGKLLGAQAVGSKGVDKRIDVLSTAIQANMTVFDLEHLELSYAPPFGSAKDPVNMAGFVASNVLRGDVEILHPEDLTLQRTSMMQVVDVRSAGEVLRMGYLPGAINIPLNSVRDRMGELDKSKKVLVYCQAGYRGYIAYRILKQSGYDVVNLDGGFKSARDADCKILKS